MLDHHSEDWVFSLDSFPCPVTSTALQLQMTFAGTLNMIPSDTGGAAFLLFTVGNHNHAGTMECLLAWGFHREFYNLHTANFPGRESVSYKTESESLRTLTILTQSKDGRAETWTPEARFQDQGSDGRPSGVYLQPRCHGHSPKLLSPYPGASLLKGYE